MQKNNSNNLQVALVVFALTVLIIGGFLFYQSIDKTPSQTVDVRGQAEVSAHPDIITVYLRVDTNASTAKDAKDENAEITEKVINSLLNSGINREKISTQNFNVYEDYEWTREGRVFRGFKATHSIKVELTSDNTDMIGTVIDAGIDNGALLQYINFEISSQKQNEYKAQATLIATQNAKMQAEAMAQGLGMKLGDVVSISDASFSGYSPYFRAYETADIAKAEIDSSEVARVVTDIQPGEQKIHANVNVVYGLK